MFIMEDCVIGIDLGTTNSCAACYKNGAIEIFENAEEETITPSFVFFFKNQSTDIIVGKYGAEMGRSLPENGIYGKYYVCKMYLYSILNDKMVFYLLFSSW
jgi:molecular chaperone DnaK (HSP70)